MAEASIPVDLHNPGQVFASLGLMEAAEVLHGEAEGGFDWTAGSQPSFRLRTAGDSDPVAAVLEFLAAAEPAPWVPVGYADTPSKPNADEDDEPDEDDGTPDVASAGGALERSETFPGRSGERMALPIRFGGGNRPIIELSHWADGSSRDSFKLYSGNRSAAGIARAMLTGVRKKPSKKQQAGGLPGDLRFKGLRQLWDEDPAALVAAPFDVLTPMGGSFNFDPRGAWNAMDVGYSPDKQKHALQASPVVEFLAAWGLEHARPLVSGRGEQRQARYAAWGARLPPMLARAALAGGLAAVSQKRFRFTLAESGKNKVVTFAQEEPGS